MLIGSFRVVFRIYMQCYMQKCFMGMTLGSIRKHGVLKLVKN